MAVVVATPDVSTPHQSVSFYLYIRSTGMLVLQDFAPALVVVMVVVVMVMVMVVVMVVVVVVVVVVWLILLSPPSVLLLFMLLRLLAEPLMLLLLLPLVLLLLMPLSKVWGLRSGPSDRPPASFASQQPWAPSRSATS